MSTAKELPNSSYLKSIFKYDRSTGNLIWRERPRELFSCANAYATFANNFAGRVAGHMAISTRTKRPHAILVYMDGKRWLAHRIIWAMTKGAIPSGMLIDHRDRNPYNNKLGNLRLATKSTNACNSRIASHNTSGVRGVCWLKKERKWRARTKVRGKEITIGRFDDISIAAREYKRAEVEHFGEFARK